MTNVFAILPFACTAAALIVSVYLFVLAKKDIRTLETRLLRQTETMRNTIEGIGNDLDETRRGLASAPADIMILPPKSINVGKRVQAVRMIRNGEGPEHISAALSLPRKQVELLIKIQRMTAESQKDARA